MEYHLVKIRTSRKCLSPVFSVTFPVAPLGVTVPPDAHLQLLRVLENMICGSLIRSINILEAVAGDAIDQLGGMKSGA